MQTTNTKSPKTQRQLKLTWARWYLIGFSLFLSLTIFYHQFLRLPVTSETQVSYSYPISLSILENLEKFTLTNAQGQWTLEQNNGVWKIEGTVTEVPKETLQQILQELKSITIQRIYDNTPLNRTQFFLENPPVKLTLQGKGNTQEISLGLINPISGSTYLSTTGNEPIYQIVLPSYPFFSVKF